MANTFEITCVMLKGRQDLDADVAQTRDRLHGDNCKLEAETGGVGD